MDPLALDTAIRSFLREDIGFGDLTTEAIFPPDQAGEAAFVAKDTFLAAGLEVAARVFQLRNADVSVLKLAPDGTRAAPGDVLLEVVGPVADLLQAERVALNLAQRLCGIATLTDRFVERVRPLPVRIVDTRKTTPGLRVLEKYAVRAGGGHNHRFGLADGILIKDNHIAACGSIAEAVRRVRARAPHTLKVEVEAATLAQVEECLGCQVEIIMLDNMTPAAMREAVALVAGRALVEASGGITLANVREAAEAGVDLISVGALTHSAPACDISMRLG
ncbi:MAG: carboxylating nicotinate-nucleotide diphosphorylase [Desulfobacteraceae bacterium]|nr:carboxylating nicotinate-nucleotide diphosphorylase [Desulfobacteraceae bacterium]